MSALDNQPGQVVIDFKINYEYLRTFILFQNIDVVNHTLWIFCRDMVSDQLSLTDVHVSIVVVRHVLHTEQDLPS